MSVREPSIEDGLDGRYERRSRMLRRAAIYSRWVGVIGSAVRGAVAGAVATAAMDLVWYRRYRADGGDRDLVTWEFSSAASDFDDDAPAPAQVGKRLADAVGVALPESALATTNNVVHWMTGIGWGKVAGLVASAVPIPQLGVGIATGVTAWGTSYAVLGKLGIYRPITEYDTATLWKDLSAHLVFGVTLGAALKVTNDTRGR
jgi:hypothetical protein